MRYLKHISEQAELFNALGSEVRLQILNLLQAKGRMSMNELADKLGLSQGALTPLRAQIWSVLIRMRWRMGI